MRYKERVMEFMERPTKVLVCSNRSASALTSISNCLLLTNQLDLESNDGTVGMSLYLERCISRRAFEHIRASIVTPTAGDKRMLKSFFDITQRLKTGIEVNPVAGTVGFEASTEYNFFQTLGIPLLHASQLNEQVFPTLLDQLEEGQVGILYLNEEFNTICKHNGTIFMLVEDEGVYKNDPSACWKTTVNEKELFVTSDFSYITAGVNKKLYKCPRCSKEFCTRINHERHAELHLPAFKDSVNHSWTVDTFAKYFEEISAEDACSIVFRAFQIAEKCHGSPFKSIIKKWITGPDFRATPPDVKDAVKQLRYMMGIERQSERPSSNWLVGTLKVASEGTFMSTDLHKGTFALVESDKSENALRSMISYISMNIEESLTEKWYADKTVQSTIAMEQILIEDKSEGSGLTKKECAEDLHKMDTAAVSLETLTAPGVPDVEVQTYKKVSKDDENHKLLPSDTSHMPQLVDGEEYFPNFVAKKTLVRIFKLFSGEKVSALTRVGRKIGKRLLKYILKVHKDGHCWNGEWTILDVRVQGNGATFCIDKEAITATKDGLVADLQKFIVLLFPYYKLEGIKGPAYFDAFHADAMDLPSLGSEKFETFQKFLADHMAFMPPWSWSGLLEKLFKWCDGICLDKNPCNFDALVRVGRCPGWTQIRLCLPYHNIFFYRAVGPEPYLDSYWDLLRFLRNFSNHGLKYTKINGIQVIDDPVVLDLMMAYDIGSVITKLVLNLLYVCKKLRSFDSIWIAYKTSDDATEENDEDEPVEHEEGI